MFRRNPLSSGLGEDNYQTCLNETYDHVSTQPSMVKKRTADNVSAKELLAEFQCKHNNQVSTVEFSKENKDSAVIQRKRVENNTQVNKLVIFGMNPQEVLYKKNIGIG